MILEKQHIDFEQIYLSYFSKMKRFAREYVLSDEDAENIVQDVFLDFWEKKELLPLPINILAYLFTSIKNRCIDFLRHKIVQKNTCNRAKNQTYENTCGQSNLFLLCFTHPVYLHNSLSKIFLETPSTLASPAYSKFVK